MSMRFLTNHVKKFLWARADNELDYLREDICSSMQENRFKHAVRPHALAEIQSYLPAEVAHVPATGV